MDTVVNVIIVLIASFLTLLVVGFLLSRLVLANNAKRARRLLPPPQPGDYEDTAIGVTAPYKAYGLLRLTPRELLFGSSSTREVLAIPRTAIAACLASDDIPTGSGMQTLQRPALVLQLNDPTLPQALGFVVAAPQEWVQRLRGRAAID